MGCAKSAPAKCELCNKEPPTDIMVDADCKKEVYVCKSCPNTNTRDLPECPRCKTKIKEAGKKTPLAAPAK